MPELKKLGVTTIVDLRGEDPGTRDRERQQAEALGLRFVNIPVSGWEPPSNEQVAQFLSLFRGDRKEKIFVHCDLAMTGREFLWQRTVWRMRVGQPAKR